MQRNKEKENEAQVTLRGSFDQMFGTDKQIFWDSRKQIFMQNSVSWTVSEGLERVPDVPLGVILKRQWSKL